MITETELAMAKNEADLIKEEAIKSILVLDEIDIAMDDIQTNSLIYGKTVDEWHDYFQILADPNADLIQIKRYCSEIIERLGVAYRFLNITEKKFSTYKHSYEKAYAEEVSKRADSKIRKTIPSADTLNLSAKSALGNRDLMCKSYEKAIEFWQRIVYMLNKKLEAIKIMSIVSSSLAKAENSLY